MPDVEIEAMAAIAAALEELDEGQRTRTLRWAADRFAVTLGSRATKGGVASSESSEIEDPDADTDGAGVDYKDLSGSDPRRFDHFADLYEACNPKTAPDKALVGAYWVQSIAGNATWGSADVNKLLKDLGHYDSHINQSFTSNINKKPALVLQVKKAGKAQQGRKTYKLSTAGINAVKAMIDA